MGMVEAWRAAMLGDACQMILQMIHGAILHGIRGARV